MRSFQIDVPLFTFRTNMFKRMEDAERWTEPERLYDGPAVCFSLGDFGRMLLRLRQKRFARMDWFDLALEAEALSLTPESDELIACRHLREHWRKSGVVPYAHQLDTARQVIFEMNGRAILADEVGLGKTIEAGLVLKEYLLRGVVQRALILTPASLCWQWYQELRQKFDIPCALLRSKYDWERTPILIASIDKAKRSPHADAARAQLWDILIVDEAHKLKNACSQNFRFLNSVRRRHCLMLTATPVQNDLRELFNLITLLAPGRLGTYAQFRGTYVESKRTPRNPQHLRRLLSSVLIRNRHSEAQIAFTDRHVEVVPIDLSASEKAFHEAIVRFARERMRTDSTGRIDVLPFILLQREACSSAYAAALTLERLIRQTEDETLRTEMGSLLDMALGLNESNSKVDYLLEYLAASDEKVIVFTEYRATQQYVRYRLSKAGIETLAFDGSLSASRKAYVQELFRRQSRVLVSTESGGEGLNFQFCRRIVNYDLPWNPMRLEQRIGRVHRLGQTRDVQITNLATKGTIEEHILYLLHEKINLFQMVIGELSAILSRLGMQRSFEGELTKLLTEAQSTEQIREGLDRLADVLNEARSDPSPVDTFLDPDASDEPLARKK